MKFQKIIPLRINHFKQRRQTMVLFALMIPLLFMFAGVGLDLGWYYLSVSRLQNAADAAVLAGAKDLLENLKTADNKYKSYTVTLVQKYPAENPYTITNGTKSATDITTEIKSAADKTALKYAQKNLSSEKTGYFFSVAEAAESNDSSMEDSWARKNEYNKVKMKSPEIYKDGEDFYYVVHLEEDVQHFFMPGRFDPMNAPVVAVAKISKATTTTNGNGPQVVFDPNGGHFVKSDGTTLTAALTIDNILKTINESGSAAVTVPDGYSSTPERDEYEFLRYWTNEDGLIVPYGTVLTEDNVEEFFKKYDPAAKDNDDYEYTSGTITLYAQWVKVKKKPVNLLFDPNGGSFSDGTTDPDSKQIKNPSEMDDDETTDPITPNKGIPLNGTKVFKGWSTVKTSASTSQTIDYIQDGKQLTKNEITALFGNNTSVTLYAVWENEVVEEEIKPHNNKTLWEQMQYLIAKNVYDPDWDVSVQKYGKEGQTAKIVHNSFDAINNTYLSSYHYYTEYINLATSVTNSSNVGNETKYFADFRRNDYIYTYLTNPKYYYGSSGISSFRVHSLFNITKAYDVRSGYNDDPLYIRFEADPGKDGNSSETAYTATPIRQIVININVSNLADGKRPLFFFYDGPDANRSGGAEPQPVILNLNADFKGVLFMPDVPVVINGNGHTFEGFIIAKEYRYLTTSGTKVKYSLDGQKITNASDNKIYINSSTGNVNSTLATGANALATYNSYATNYFKLSSSSKFRSFKIDTDVNFMYVFYDNTMTLDETPFHEYCDLDNDLIPLYKLDDAGNQVRVTKWGDVKLYDSDDFDTRNEIPKQLTDDKSIRTVRLDSDGNPSPLYDEAGNPVYFCDDYIKLTGTYEVLTLDRVADGTRDPKEFLLTADTENISEDTNVSNTDDWK